MLLLYLGKKTRSHIFNMLIILIDERYKQFMLIPLPSLTVENQGDISVTRAQSGKYSPVILQFFSFFLQRIVFKQDLAQKWKIYNASPFALAWWMWAFHYCEMVWILSPNWPEGKEEGVSRVSSVGFLPCVSEASVYMGVHLWLCPDLYFFLQGTSHTRG